MESISNFLKKTSVPADVKQSSEPKEDSPPTNVWDPTSTEPVEAISSGSSKTEAPSPSGDPSKLESRESASTTSALKRPTKEEIEEAAEAERGRIKAAMILQKHKDNLKEKQRKKRHKIKEEIKKRANRIRDKIKAASRKANRKHK